ncbi:MAG TPA: hypothetical protein VFE98_09995 [Candidatus Bathyarchaeia archaeon]|nr:hypothetical protein [Candidatus Bathyarchaeia archaeon]
MASKTTVQVDEDILKLLGRVKRAKSLKSYSEALREILKESKTLRRSERGSLPRLKSFVREKNDRFD